MSSQDPSFIVRVEPESLHNKTIIAIISAGVLIIVLSLIVVHLMLNPSDRFIPSPLAGAAPREISRIDQTLVDVDESWNNYRASQARRLERYEWVDRKQGIVRIPIDRAFILLEEGRQP